MHSSFTSKVDNFCLSSIKIIGKMAIFAKKLNDSVVFYLLSVTNYQMTN